MLVMHDSFRRACLDGLGGYDAANTSCGRSRNQAIWRTVARQEKNDERRKEKMVSIVNGMGSRSEGESEGVAKAREAL